MGEEFSAMSLVDEGAPLPVPLPLALPPLLGASVTTWSDDDDMVMLYSNSPNNCITRDHTEQFIAARSAG